MRDTFTLTHAQLLQLKRWNTPTIYNGWEQITSHDPAQVGINLEPTTDFMPQMGSMVGYAVTVVAEVNANIHRALGCVGCIVDGSIRDLDEMTNAGFHALAARLSVGHAHAVPLRWGEPVQVFGQTVEPGQLIHADKHGFLAVPREGEEGLLEASIFMDTNECETLISTARNTANLTKAQMADNLAKASEQFGRNAQERFGDKR